MDADYDYLFKILVIGDPGAGKSSLLHRFADDVFTDKYTLTLGVEYKVRTLALDGKLVKLQLWDTAGQEIFRSVTSSCYRGAHGVILVYDVTRQETFQNLKYWLKEVEKYASENVIRILVGNKIDKSSEKLIGYETAEAFANQHAMPFIETSAKTACNVDKTFAMMAIMIRNSVIAVQDLEDFPGKDTISLGFCQIDDNRSWSCC